jgi:hypothetical protein
MYIEDLKRCNTKGKKTMKTDDEPYIVICKFSTTQCRLRNIRWIFCLKMNRMTSTIELLYWRLQKEKRPTPINRGTSLYFTKSIFYSVMRACKASYTIVRATSGLRNES